MDWRSVTFDWNRARAFLVTAEEGSLSAAARALKLTQPTLGRQVEALEAELGVALFERTGRGLRLTAAGHALLDHARLMGDGARALSLAAWGQTEALEGEVAISASDADASYLLPPILARLHAAEPGIRIEVVVSNDLSDLSRREADIAVRNVRPTASDLIARKLRDATARLYAAPAYLERIGRPDRPEGFADADFIEIDGRGSLRSLLAAQGFALGEANFPYRCRNFAVMWEMVRRGMGIGILDDRIGDPDPAVERAAPFFAPVAFPVWLVTHRDIARSRRLRVVFDALVEGLGA
ncbi:transcriptional regulator, LysR family protein [Oceanicola granulosus HTCC2516]|uniref:Transcriptional regulator, LysR family protein n=1 Tax=Oceanicola granulosus (strain ATCC BAA-861 / DSM 15982 / KCTC 12143 / HTCC2516) TaxID=314256 RepID=Q2CET7_OCEGH|nr:LysR family transcriptional regulator [Oceanicola granulosus]EAR51171.1 transcriptional regulator, LysR family protein [Oceanicola granulosus HTCC2516]